MPDPLDPLGPWAGWLGSIVRLVASLGGSEMGFQEPGGYEQYGREPREPSWPATFNSSSQPPPTAGPRSLGPGACGPVGRSGNGGTLRPLLGGIEPMAGAASEARAERLPAAVVAVVADPETGRCQGFLKSARPVPARSSRGTPAPRGSGACGSLHRRPQPQPQPQPRAPHLSPALPRAARLPGPRVSGAHPRLWESKTLTLWGMAQL